MQRLLLVIGVLIGLCACVRTQPQRPTFRGETKQDSIAVGALVLNQNMAEQADLHLSHYADSGFVQLDNNAWVKGELTTDSAQMLQEDEYVSLEATFCTLKGQLLFSHQAEVQVGKADEIQAVQDILPWLKKDRTVTMLVPWYLAFGSAGNDYVPPYENIRVELKINEIYDN